MTRIEPIKTEFALGFEGVDETVMLRPLEALLPAAFAGSGVFLGYEVRHGRGERAGCGRDVDG